MYFQRTERGTFEGHPLSSYTLSPMMLPLLEIFLELLLWSSLQWHYSFMCSLSLNLRPSKQTLTFGNSQMSLGSKSGEHGGCSISVIDFLARNCLTAPCELELCHGWTKVHAIFDTQLQVTISVFPHNQLGWLALWDEDEVKGTLDMEESDEHCLHLWFRHAIWTVYVTQKHLHLS